MKNDSSNIKGVQRLNRLRVLNTIRRRSVTVRSDIVEYTGLSPASVSVIVHYLNNAGLVIESGVENVDRTGRKGILLQFDGRDYRLITASNDCSSLRIYLTDLVGEVYGHLEYRIQNFAADTVANLLCSGVAELVRSPEGANVIAVGLSASAMVLDHGQRIVSSSLQWNIPKLREQLKSIKDVPFLVSNSTFTKAIWLCDACKPENEGSILFIDLTKGIGAAVINSGVLLSSVTGEIGHTTVAPDGERCACGNRGCLEVMCSTSRLLNIYKAHSGSSAENLATLARLFAQDDPAAKAAVDECAGYLGIGLANLINLFNPDKLVINIQDFVQFPAFVDRACELMRTRVLDGLGQNLCIEIARFENDDMVRAMSRELCDLLFSEEASTDVFQIIDDIVPHKDYNAQTDAPANSSSIEAR